MKSIRALAEGWYERNLIDGPAMPFSFDSPEFQAYNLNSIDRIRALILPEYRDPQNIETHIVMWAVKDRFIANMSLI